MTTKRTEVTIDWDPTTDAVCAVIVEAVAEAKDIDPLELEVPLYEVVDPDALDRLFERTGRAENRQNGWITFQYEDCAITVDAAGTVTARPETPAAEGASEDAMALGAGFSP